MPRICSKTEEKKTWIVTLYLEKNLYFELWCFQNNFSKCLYRTKLFKSMLYLDYQHQQCDLKAN